MDELPVTATEIASWVIAAIAVAIVLIGAVVLLVTRRRSAARVAEASEADDAADTDAPGGTRGDAPDA